MDKLRTETLCIQAGYTPGNGEPRQIPIIQSITITGVSKYFPTSSLLRTCCENRVEFVSESLSL